jgi:hypothetical protein
MSAVIKAARSGIHPPREAADHSIDPAKASRNRARAATTKLTVTS